MAERPVKMPLPADLPENWQAEQIVAPDGTSVGLTEQHGYNYLMQMVNRTQSAVNEVNEAFESISVTTRYRMVVGTSAAGWTEDDCDYLCDGTDDQVEIQQALNAVSDEGEVLLLKGSYHLTGQITVLRRTLRGGGRSTVLSRDTADGAGAEKTLIYLMQDAVLSGFSVNTSLDLPADIYQVRLGSRSAIDNVCFGLDINNCIVVDFSSAEPSKVQSCLFSGSRTRTCIYVTGNSENTSSNKCLIVENNVLSFALSTTTFLETGARCNLKLLMRGNFGINNGGAVVLDGDICAVIESNRFTQIRLLNTGNLRLTGGGSIVAGNVLGDTGYPDKPAVFLGEGTSWNFVACNSFCDQFNGVQHTVQDLGSNNIVRFNSSDLAGSTPATVQAAAPILSVDADGTITASVNQKEGFVAAGSRNTSLKLSPAQDADFVPENIKEGVNIFGVEGTMQGGLTAGVESFNGRTGAVMPESGDFSAAMVGARPDTWVPTAEDTGAATMEQVNEAIQAAILDSWEGSY